MKKKPYKITPWAKLPLFLFVHSEMRALVTMEQTGAFSCYHIKIPVQTEVKPSYHKKAEEIIWVVKGSGVGLLNGRLVPLAAGDVLFLPPRNVHGFLTRESEMELLTVLAPRVDSKTDFYSLDKEGHGEVRVFSGRFRQGKPAKKAGKGGRNAHV